MQHSTEEDREFPYLCLYIVNNEPLYNPNHRYPPPTIPTHQTMTFFHQASAVLSALYAYPILLALGPIALVILFTAHSYYRLSHVPGPFLASFTNLSRLSWVLSNRAHDIHTALHRQYGPLVRFGPNMVSIADPAEVGNIYRFVKPWLKVSRRW